ncbi:transposase [Deinococcus cellulosilyticus NBRC 106333 = KACC 11606]|uniref:Transposase n=1 Tax=Deinococcus cellulosilyticus (strain DSM 18568 / NBRC 106333 / KACC 11606 / 5516J-15) TaxID=1223518 RepID=A0A511N2W9_DEIC1|nr:transposase [Deinococcus cellulosilyticus NBRC 106333 = KACC 11606]
MTLTAKLKLCHNREQKTQLDQVTLAYRDALNYTSQKAFEMEKTSNAAKIQQEVYKTLRERFGLGAQMACSVPRYVGAAYKTLWTKVKQSKVARELNPKARRYKGLDNPPRFVSRTLSYQYQRDYSFKKGQQVSIMTLKGRLVLPYEGYAKHLEFIANGAEMGTAKLWYSKARKQYFLLVPLTIELSDPEPSSHKQVVGVDVGMRYLATASNTSGKTLFKSGKATLRKAERFLKARKSLQQKGTRSATRRLVMLSGRERRFIADTNSSLAVQILKTFPQAFIGVEELTHVRDRTERRSRPHSSEQQRKANRRRARWSYAELQGFLAYKAALRGSMVVKVDAHYTSQTCPRCGHCSRGNRPEKGLMFACESCGYQLHADLVGARNVGLRALLVRQDWASTGCLSCIPDVSDVETKVERLKRYSELRWSPDTSQRL